MANTPDHHPGQIEYVDTGSIYSDAGASVPTTAGSIGYSNAVFSLTDGVGSYEPRSVYQLTHTALADLIHYLDDGPAITGAYKVTVYASGPFVKSVTWYTSNAQTKKIVDRTLTYPAASYAVVTADVWRIYASDGATVLHTVSDQIVNQGVLESTRTRTYT